VRRVDHCEPGKSLKLLDDLDGVTACAVAVDDGFTAADEVPAAFPGGE